MKIDVLKKKAILLCKLKSYQKADITLSVLCEIQCKHFKMCHVSETDQRGGGKYHFKYKEYDGCIAWLDDEYDPDK